MAKIKKVLIAYFPRPPIIEYLKAAFERKGVEAYGYFSDTDNWFDKYVIHYINKTAHNLRLMPKSKDFFKDHPLSHLHYRSQKLLERVEEVSPDLVIIVRGWRFTEEALSKIRQRSMLFGWWIESEERVREPLRELECFDHYSFMNSSCVEEAAKKGFKNISLLHHSVSKDAFYPMDVPKQYDWCFVGGWSPKRMDYIESALKVSRNAVIYGSKWIKKNPFNRSLYGLVKGAYISGSDLVRLYSSTKVVLNVTNWGGDGDKRSGMNMRVLEVPACRALLLTDGSKDLRNVVTAGEHVGVYEGMDEFMEKLAFYIKNQDERERIALSGYRHVISNYTYDDVAGQILGICRSGVNSR